MVDTSATNEVGQKVDFNQQRLDLADTRGFAAPGAGPERRLAMAELGRTWIMDVWNAATRGARPGGVALASVGSVARGDAGPLSDFDLVLLHDGRSLSTKEITSLADRIWYPIWDGGAKLDHSVRTVNQCRTVAAGDLSAAIGLLDLELVAGDEQVVAAARSTVGHDWRSNARRRLPELIESLEARHRRHGDLAQTIEPDLKEARGGLRDMTVLRALTSAWLADRPHGQVDAAYGTLLDTRDALHMVTGRGRDRLGLEEQDAVAALLGHPDADAMLVDVSNAARTLSYAINGTVRRASQSQRARTLRVGPRRPVLKPLGFGLFEHDGEVVLGAHLDPSRRPPAGTSRCRRRGPPRSALVTRDAGEPGCAFPRAPGAVDPPCPVPVRRPPRGRPGADHGVGGSGPCGAYRLMAAGVGRGPEPTAAQRRSSTHGRPAPDRDGRSGYRPDARRGAPRSSPACRSAARHRQDRRRP